MSYVFKKRGSAG